MPTKRRDKKLQAEISAAMVLNMAKQAVNDRPVVRLSLVKLQARAVMNEKVFAERVIADDKEKRRLRQEIKKLRKALAKACDWALDSADVIADENIVDPEDGEDEDFRATIGELRELSQEPEAERHVARRKAREEEQAQERLARRKAQEPQEEQKQEQPTP